MFMGARPCVDAYGDVSLEIAVEELVVIKMHDAAGKERGEIVVGIDVGENESAAFRVDISSGEVWGLLKDVAGIVGKACAMIHGAVGACRVVFPVERIDAERDGPFRNDAAFFDARGRGVEEDNDGEVVFLLSDLKLREGFDIVLGQPPSEAVCGDELFGILRIAEEFLE